MTMRISSQPALAVLVLAALWGLAAAAVAQGPAQKSARALGLDAAPSDLSTPDPLAPPETTGPAPAAPGVPTAPPEPKAGEEVDPIVTLVRERLAKPLTRGSSGDRDDYAGLAAFYAGNGDPVWVGKDGFTARAQLAIKEIRAADDWGLKASAFDLPSAPNGEASNEARADAEIKLGLAVLKYGRQARGGRVDPSSVSHMFDQKPTIYDPKTLMQAVAASDAVDRYLRELHPKHPQFHRLREALLAARGTRTQEDAATPSVKIPQGPQIKPGQDHPQIALFRQRLAVAGEAGKETLYDDPLVEEVKAFQQQHHLEANGIINGATRSALNGQERAASSETVQRLIVNMERWRWLPADLGAFYVWDSVPEQMTSVFADGKQVLSEKLVVGKPSTPTPIFSANMQFIIFHPSWGVPPGMKAQELAPQLRNSGGWFFGGYSASDVLRSHGLLVSRGGHPIDPDSVSWQSVDIRSFDFTQPPGARNVLGIVKFRFPNKHDVYMHDTPERNLFGGAVRAFSHGCMRVQNPIRLAEVVLAYDKGWSSEKVAEYVRGGGEIKLEKAVPVHISYFTAVVDDGGKVRFHGDIYGLDGRLASALEGQAVRLASASVAPSPAATQAEDAEEPQPARKSSSQRGRRKPSTVPTFNPFSW
jgi:murein L,D-transpeptidase YcbB/YkuD